MLRSRSSVFCNVRSLLLSPDSLPALLTLHSHALVMLVPSQHIRPPGFCCGWPDGLELSPGQSPGFRCYYRQLQVLVKNVFIFSVPVQIVLDLLRRAPYKFTLLTYVVTCLLTLKNAIVNVENTQIAFVY